MLISIVMATYNGGRFLQKQLDSLFAQTYKDIEIIACDDFSTDNTVSILKQYPQIKLLQNEKNLGFVKTFEKTLKEAKGSYIALCDQDDIWLPEKIQTLADNIGDNLLMHSDAYTIDESDNILPQMLSEKINRFSRDRSFFDRIRRNAITGCTVIIKKELLDTALPFPESIPYHDWWLAICAAKTGGIAYLPAPLIKYRLHSNNASFKNYDKASFYKRSVSNNRAVLKKFKNSLSFKEFFCISLHSIYLLAFKIPVLKLIAVLKNIRSKQ